VNSDHLIEKQREAAEIFLCRHIPGRGRSMSGLTLVVEGETATTIFRDRRWET
jgi:hypothetical protein